MRPLRLLASSLGMVLVGGMLGVVAAAPAEAYEYRDVSKSGWAYTDSRSPDRSFINPSGDAPIGAHTDADGVTHRYRSYFTFDISRFRQTVIHKADLVIVERSAADCAEAQPVELWRTDAITERTSWRSPPRRRQLLGMVRAGGEAACPGYLAWDVMAAMQKLAKRGEQTLTIEIRVPHGAERDVAHGRTLRPFPVIHVQANHAPAVDRIGLEYPSWSCGTKTEPQPVGARTYGLMMQATDVDSSDWVSGQFAAWPVARPEERVERFGSGYGSGFAKADWDMSQYPHGTVVAWAARAYDEHDYSTWAAPCYVRIDGQAPAKPVVVSSDYPDDGRPHGGEGVPGTFTFKANGSADVVGYYWGRFGDAYNYVPAPEPGADVEISYTPTSFVEFISVQSVDSAANRSELTSYDFYVNTTAPAARVTVGGVGLPSKMRISTDVAGVTEFGYQIGEAAEVRIPAGADGTAETSIVFEAVGVVRLQVRGYVAGKLVGASTQSIDVSDAPFIESDDFAFPTPDGVVDRPGTFAFRPARPGVVAYEYSFGYDAMRRIDAAADGTAVLSWTPTEADWVTLRVRSIGADGTVSEISEYQFSVIDVKPTVYSGTYYDFGAWGGVGIPGEFGFTTAMPDVDVFVYQFNDGPEQTVDPEYSWAEVTLTPDRSGVNTLAVRTRFLDGSFSPVRTYRFEVSDAPVVVSTDYPENAGAGQPGKPGRFTFNPGRPDVVEYRYAVEYSGEEQVVAAGPDGRATVEITPAHPGYTLLTVTSRSADGTVSPERRYYFVVRDPRVNVSSGYDDYAPRGGIGSVGLFGFYTEIDEVTTFEYRVNDGAWRSVPKTPQSLETQVSVTMERNGANVFSVRGRTEAGEYTPQTDYPFLVGTAPLVSSSTYPAGGWSGGVGVPGEFVFTQGSPGVTEFEYRVEDDEPTLVAADADGVATVTYTPTSAGSHTMRVRGRTADGQWTDTTSHYFLVR